MIIIENRIGRQFLSSEAIFDLGSRKSFWENLADIIKKVAKKNYVDICNGSGVI